MTATSAMSGCECSAFSTSAESTATLLLVIFQGLNNHTLLPLDPDGPVVTQFCDLVETFLSEGA